mmetsp:Transcript_39300/g.28424  ORF Transcript_39300/g.28424 Transcript_39300/m.28424 type:complete len:283 (-) Transcript_39300:148-996(-)
MHSVQTGSITSSQWLTKSTLRKTSTRLLPCTPPSAVKLAPIAPSKIQFRYVKRKLPPWLLISLRRLAQTGQVSKVSKRNGDSHCISSQRAIVPLQVPEPQPVIIIKVQDGQLLHIHADQPLLSTSEEEPNKSHGITTTVLSLRLSLVMSMSYSRILRELPRKAGWPLLVPSGSTHPHKLLNHQCMMLFQVSGKETQLMRLPVSPQALVPLSTSSMVQLSAVDGLNKQQTVSQIIRELWDISKSIFQLMNSLLAQECKHSHPMELDQSFLIGTRTGLDRSASL